MADNQQKKSSIVGQIFKIAGAIVGAVLIGEVAHKGNEGNQRNKAMKASMQENNKKR